MRKLLLILVLSFSLTCSAFATLVEQIQQDILALEDLDNSTRESLYVAICNYVPNVSNALEMRENERNAFKAALESGLFEEIPYNTIARTAAFSMLTVRSGADVEATLEIALISFSQELEPAIFLESSLSLSKMVSNNVPIDTYREAISYSIFNKWPAEKIRMLSDALVLARQQSVNLEKFLLAMILRLDTGLEASDLQQAIDEEISFIRGLGGDTDEYQRQDRIYNAKQRAINNGVNESVASDLYSEAVQNKWPAEDVETLFSGMEKGVNQGLSSERLGLALLLRMEMDHGQVPVRTMVNEEIEYVKTIEADRIKLYSQSIPLKTDPKIDIKQAPPIPDYKPEPKRDPEKQKKDTPVPPPALDTPSQSSTITKSHGNIINHPLMASSINSYIGTPYLWGGNDRRGVDCSGFTRAVYFDQGKRIPRVSRDQYKTGKRVNDLEYGDLVFFNRNGWGRVTHVGIYVGNNKFAHASCSKGVTISNLNKKYYRKRYKGARRILG